MAWRRATDWGADVSLLEESTNEDIRHETLPVTVCWLRHLLVKTSNNEEPETTMSVRAAPVLMDRAAQCDTSRLRRLAPCGRTTGEATGSRPGKLARVVPGDCRAFAQAGKKVRGESHAGN